MGQIVSLAFRSVFPLLALMLLGIFLRSSGMLSETTITQLNKISTKVFIPCLLFNNVYTANLHEAFQLRLFAFELACTLLIAASLYLLVPRLIRDRKTQCSYACSLYWPNCTMFGLPILTSLCGAEGTLTGTIMIVTIAPLFSAGAAVFLERYKSRGHLNGRQLLTHVFANPMLWGSILGVSCNLLSIRLPHVILSPIRSVAGIATPLALICLGGFFKWESSQHLFQPALLGCFCKLLLTPTIVALLALLCGYSGLHVLCLLIIFASPSAVSTFSVTDPSFANCELSAMLVSLSSILSVFTYFFWIVLYQSLAQY